MPNKPVLTVGSYVDCLIEKVQQESVGKKARAGEVNVYESKVSIWIAVYPNFTIQPGEEIAPVRRSMLSSTADSHRSRTNIMLGQLEHSTLTQITEDPQ